MKTTKKLHDGTVVPVELLQDYRAVAVMDGEAQYKGQVFFDMQFVKPGQECPNCRGPKGHGMLYAPTGDKSDVPYHFGGSVGERPAYKRKMRGYPCPICAVAGYRAVLAERCGVTDNEATESTEVWDIDGRERMKSTVDGVVSEWTNTRPHGWLTLVGPYGCGKTKLTQVLVRRCVASGIPARYILAKDLAQAIMATVTTDKTLDDVLGMFRDVTVLAIDQLDWLRQRTHSGEITMVIEELLSLLDHRYRGRQTQGTVLVFNSEWYNAGGGELAPVLSRASEGWIASTDIANLREAAGQIERAL